MRIEDVHSSNATIYSQGAQSTDERVNFNPLKIKLASHLIFPYEKKR
jgi:hypothetical protein